jgi:hypothetical protein
VLQLDRLPALPPLAAHRVAFYLPVITNVALTLFTCKAEYVTALKKWERQRSRNVTVTGHLLLMRKGTSDMVAVQVALRGYVHETNLEGKEEMSAGGQKHAHAE